MSGAVKDSQKGGKPRMSLIAGDAMEELAWILTHGAKKYAPNNWAKGMAWSDVADALLRHFYKWQRGEDYDVCDDCRPLGGHQDNCRACSGRLHIGQVLCNAMFLTSYKLRAAGTDDRFKYQTEDQEGPFSLSQIEQAMGDAGFLPADRDAVAMTLLRMSPPGSIAEALLTIAEPEVRK